MKKLLLLIPALLLLAMNGGHCSSNKYPSDGIYLTFSTFRSGEPDIRREQLFKDLKANQPAVSFRQWFNSPEKYLQTDTAGVVPFGETPVWGYVENGTLYILLNGKFHKMLLLGTISYFLESYPVVRGQMSPVVTDARTVSSYKLLDMKTGRVGTYEAGRLETLMKDDQELFDEFRSIVSAKTKEKKMYSFMERYNQRHQLTAIIE
ncbi:MAG: hypothetical protein ACKO0X_03975 [Bacteroidota bacterium]